MLIYKVFDGAGCFSWVRNCPFPCGIRTRIQLWNDQRSSSLRFFYSHHFLLVVFPAVKVGVKTKEVVGINKAFQKAFPGLPGYHPRWISDCPRAKRSVTYIPTGSISSVGRLAYQTDPTLPLDFDILLPSLSSTSPFWHHIFIRLPNQAHDTNRMQV